MATVEELTAAASAVSASVSTLSETISAESAQVAAAIQALKDQVAAGTVTGVDPAALDPLLASLQGITSATEAARASVEAIFTPDAPPV